MTLTFEAIQFQLNLIAMEVQFIAIKIIPTKFHFAFALHALLFISYSIQRLFGSRFEKQSISVFLPFRF